MRKYVKIGCVLLCLLLLLLSACGDRQLPTPAEVYAKLTQGYGSLPYGMYYETNAKEWDQAYLSPKTAAELFGSDSQLRQTVQEGCLYISGAPEVHEEIAVLLCYSSEGALQMAGILAERARNLALTEDAWDAPKTQTVCRGRYLIYCRLSKDARAKKAIERLDL